MSEELAHHGYKISPGSLYPTLHKMEEEGLLRSHSEVVAGRSRRSYVATVKGRRDLKETIVQLRELAHEVLGEDAKGPTPGSRGNPRQRQGSRSGRSLESGPGSDASASAGRRPT